MVGLARCQFERIDNQMVTKFFVPAYGFKAWGGHKLFYKLLFPNMLRNHVCQP